MQKRLLMAALAATAAAPTAHAAENLYVRGAAGLTFASALDGSTKLVSGASSTRIQGPVDLETGLAVQGAVGRSFGESFRLEAEVSYAGGDYGTTASIKEGTSKTYGVWLNGYYDLPDIGKITPYFGVGVGYATVKVEFNDVDNDQLSADESTWGYQAFAGVSYAMSDRLSLEGSYRYSIIPEVTVQDGPYGQLLGGDFVEFNGDRTDHSVTVGLRYALGRKG